MKQKYIKQVDNQNFLYPNNYLAEYDVNIVHDLIEGNVTGTTTQPVLTKNGANIDVSVDYTWDLNGAEPFYNNQGALNLINVYFQTPDRQYFDVWVNVYILQTSELNTTATGGTMNFTITPAMMNQASFSTNGNYSITFQCISRRTIYPMPWLIPLQVVTPTPTPTPSPTHGTPTPTPTNPPPTPTPTPTRVPSCDCSYYNVVISSHDIDASIGNDVHPYWNNTVWARYSECGTGNPVDKIYNSADNYYHSFCNNNISGTPYLYYHINDVPTTAGITSTIDQSPDCCNPAYSLHRVKAQAAIREGVCDQALQSVYTVYGYTLTTGTAIFTDTELTMPLIGYDYIVEPSAGGEIWQITSGYGVITTSTGYFC
jgi:hypothetical protein